MMLRDPGCTRCPLHETATTVCVPGDGSITSRVMLVGEAPGADEDRQGLPFVGKSGQLLRAAMAEFGIEGRIENTVRCRPPGNRDPSKEEVKACRSYLLDTIQVMPALEYVVTLGKPALAAFGVKGQMMKLAGNPKPLEASGKKLTLLPIAHPAYVLRSPAYADTWESHWRLLRTLLDGQDDPSKLIGWDPDGWKEIIGG